MNEGEISPEAVAELYEATGVSIEENVREVGEGLESGNSDSSESGNAPDGASISDSTHTDGQDVNQTGETDGDSDEALEEDGSGAEQEEPGDSEEDSETTEKGGEGISSKRDRSATGRIKELAREKNEWKEKYEELRAQAQEEKIAKEDPKYTIEDFAKVTDADGLEVELTETEQELEFLKWEKGYNQRAAEREANERSEMAKFTGIYDDIALAMEKYPEFDEESDKYDADISAKALKLINRASTYNEQGELISMSISPLEIVETIASLGTKKAAPTAVAVNKIKATRPAGVSSRVVKSSDESNLSDEIKAMYKATGVDINKLKK